jgi:4-hydroxybenzoate polyprenyltransferase
MSSLAIASKILAWLKTARLHFYLMAWIGYTLGALAASMNSLNFNVRIYILGYIFLFLTELGTILVNEYYDYESDRINANRSVFTGGSGMLVHRHISTKELKLGIAATLSLILIVGTILLLSVKRNTLFFTALLLFLGLILGLGYTVPPIKFCYRGMGEITVGITFSFYVILGGFGFQSGRWNDPFPWLLSVPLFFATLAPITLSGIPDYQADKRVLKKTFALIFGPRKAAILSLVFISTAAVAGIMLLYLGVLGGVIGWILFITIPHCIIVWYAVLKLIKSGDYNRRINSIMVLSLTYIIWFGLIPLLHLLRGNTMP